MAKKGGFPGGMPANMGNLMKQAQKMQQQMAEAQEELEASEFTASAGGGVVEVTVGGNKEIKNIKIDPDVVDPEDVEMLADLVMAATNEALRTATKEKEEKMDTISGGLNIPGLF